MVSATSDFRETIANIQKKQQRPANMDSDEEFYFSENSVLKSFILFPQKKRQFWVNSIFENHDLSEYFQLFKELKEQPVKFHEYYRMTYDTYCYILNAIEGEITKQSNFRECISPSERLTVTLR